MRAPLPENEVQRLAALHSVHVLDTPPEPAFDHMTRLACQLCGTPIGVISLVDASRQWFKAKVGINVSETPRENAFCAHALLSDEPLVIPDTQLDARFADNPMVAGEPHIRFYAGIPLTLAPSLSLGTLCVLDSVPHQLHPEQLEGLKLLARQVITELSLRRELASVRAREKPVSEPSLALTQAASAAPRTEPRMTAADSTYEATLAALPFALGGVLAGRYRTERSLGAGGMGAVVSAWDLHLERPVALKVMLPAACAQPGALERFTREAKVLLELRHPNIARLLDVGNLENGLPFLVMERLEGEDAAQRLRRGPLSVPEAVNVLLQTCEGVAHAHARGVLHRDLKPANLFLARQPDGTERVKVLDFGVSKLCADGVGTAERALTGTHVLVGSPRYMSPEQMRSSHGLDARSDVWSLGVVLYELLAGAPPYDGTLVEICAKVLAHASPCTTALSPLVPAALCEVIERCMRREREARFRSANELAAALRATLSSPGPRTAAQEPAPRS